MIGVYKFSIRSQDTVQGLVGVVIQWAWSVSYDL